MRKTGPSLETVYTVLFRSGGACERCGRAACDVHHRKPRRMGGTRDPVINSPANLVVLCRACHSDIECNRASAMVEGWLLYAQDEPADKPVHMNSAWVHLTHEGTYRNNEPENDAQRNT